MPDAKLLTTKEACHYLFGKFNRNTKSQMYRFLKSGVLGSIRFGDTGQHYWRTVDLDELIASDPQKKEQVIMSNGMLTPTTFEGAMQFSETMAQSSMVPKAFQGKPADILVAVQWGSEVGLPPLAALQNIAVINGKPSIYGDSLLALVTGHPEYGGHEETIARPDDEAA